MKWPPDPMLMACGAAFFASAAGAQPFVVSNPQRVVGATGGCCSPGAVSTFALGAWVQGTSAQCFPGGGIGQSSQNTQISGTSFGGSGSAGATAGSGAGCDVQATSSMLVPFQTLSAMPVRMIARLEGSGLLRATAELRVLPLLSVVRSWQSPADVEDGFTLAPGSYRLSVSAGGGVNAPGGSGAASFDFSFQRWCYANCDDSTIPPLLTVQDFTCFSNRFAAGDSRANCDGSTRAPVLNVNDFVCFLNRFAAGCS